MLLFSSQKFSSDFNRVGVYYSKTSEAARSDKSFLLQPPTLAHHHSQWYKQHFIFWATKMPSPPHFASKIKGKYKYQTLTLEFSQSPSKQLVLNIDNSQTSSFFSDMALLF